MDKEAAVMIRTGSTSSGEVRFWMKPLYADCCKWIECDSHGNPCNEQLIKQEVEV